jgi:hypothetical protein
MTKDEEIKRLRAEKEAALRDRDHALIEAHHYSEILQRLEAQHRKLLDAYQELGDQFRKLEDQVLKREGHNRTRGQH